VSPRAKMIQGQPGSSQLFVVYGRDVQQREVAPVVSAMDAVPGIQARVVMGAMDDPKGPKVPVVLLTIAPGTEMLRAMDTLKRVANPELPIAIRHIKVVLLICRCNYVSSVLDTLEFYRGLGPQDVQAFRAGYIAGMRTMPVARLFSEESQPPYKPLTDGIETMLAELGARATVVEIAPRRDPRPCTHS
jgi:hypothetical protein